MSSLPSESLYNLYNDLDFLAASMADQKPCFKNRYYVDATSYIAWAWRMLDGEHQAITGNAHINSICRNAFQTYESDNNMINKPVLMRKIIDARKGLDRIKTTYIKIGKRSVGDAIGNSILILDQIIPDEMAIKEGFRIKDAVSAISHTKTCTKSRGSSLGLDECEGYSERKTDKSHEYFAHDNKNHTIPTLQTYNLTDFGNDSSDEGEDSAEGEC
jgi:hypothetical protein